MTAASRGTLLCVVNYPANTGYAWDFIEGLYAQVANRIVTDGIRTFVAYPSIPAAPRSLAGSAAEPVVLDAGLETEASVRATEEFIRREGVQVLYLTDRHARSATYPRLRRAGVRRIIMHDHTSGARTRPTGLKRAAKWVAARVPGQVADVVVAVSDYVARRQLDVGMIPARRVRRIWNGLPVPDLDPKARERLHELLPGVSEARPIIACACRAASEKGVNHLLDAFDEVRRGYRGESPPALVYIGDGPGLADLRAQRERLATRDDIVLAGYRPAASALLEGADICVVPSVWQDAFPLAVLEAMARARPVIGTAVGGIPEMIEDGVTGLLVPPADPVALAAALQRLLGDGTLRARLGTAARNRASQRFTPDAQITALARLVTESQ